MEKAQPTPDPGPNPAVLGARVPSESAWNAIQRLVGVEHLRPATADDAVAGVQPQRVAEPGTAEELARILQIANASELRVAPRGGGSKLDWGTRPRTVDLALSTSRLNRVIEHAWEDMTASVEAGCTIAELQRTLAEHGQRLALDPLWPERATVGGVLATNDSGPLRVRFGSLRDLIIGVTLALPDGTLANSGGKVVKNVAGYDLPKLATGSFGTLGVITRAIFRLHPLPRDSRTLTFSAAGVADLNRMTLAVLDSQLAFTGLQIRAGSDLRPVLDIRFEGLPEAMEAQARRLTAMSGFDRSVATSPEVWQAREAIFSGPDPAVVCKCSVLPTDIARLYDLTQEIASRLQLNWEGVVQAVGLGMLQLHSRDMEAFVASVHDLRGRLASIHGSLVVLRCPAQIKAQVDVWGPAGDTQPLMNRIKQQFDPAAMLNPGRFVGGI